jgi:2-polyprenyl-3-methyl-5-hydroxy-6-metoxy-1,4-benzoquinol methylase
VDCALSLGCGNGYLEREALRLNIARTFYGLDVSPQAIALAQEKAREEGIHDHLHYAVADLNQDCLDPGRYDLVLAAMSIHHVKNLDHLLEQIDRCLKPSGLFILNEYVGP